MENIESPAETCMEYCLSCAHFQFCLVYWGTDCKRQGGNKIPRMKSKRVEERRMADRQQSKKHKPMNTKPKNQIIKISEPIRTKAANW